MTCVGSRKGNRPPARGGPEKGRERPRGGGERGRADASGSGGDERTRGGGRGRGRRRHGGSKQPDGAARVLSTRAKPVDLERGDVEEPLSPHEVAALRQHFRFLREHRRELRLKVNAAEDLLLNGDREPTHRGVCQHLLGKVERGSVLSASERLAPAQAAALLAGIIRFSADIEYVLLFLEKIKLSSPPSEATAALSQGLQRIDFDKASAGQMRRVLDLLTELFDESERPALLLGMLESRSFRDAFDRSISGLPESLSHLVLPLRAAQAVVLHGRQNPFDSATLRQGVQLLLDARDRILLRHAPEVRQRLFRFGLQACCAPDHRLHRSLRVLLTSFPASDRGKAKRALSLARHLMGADEEAGARKVLEELTREAPDHPVSATWLRLLDGERLDRVALLDEPTGLKDALEQHPRRAGICLETMRPVWIQPADPEHLETHEAAARLLRELCITGVAPLLASGTAPNGGPYFVVPRSGAALASALTERTTLGRALRLCLDGIQILAALATAGVQLPEAGLRRFACQAKGALLLTDVAGARRVGADAAGAAHLELAREFSRSVLDEARDYIAPMDVVDAIQSARSCAELARVFTRSLQGDADGG